MNFEAAEYYENQFISEPIEPEKDGLFWRRTLIGNPDAASDCL